MEEKVPTSHRKRIIAVAAIIVCIIVLLFITFAVFINQSIKPSVKNTPSRHPSQTLSQGSVPVLNDTLLVQTQFMFAKIDAAARKTEIYRRPAGSDSSVKVLDSAGVFTGLYSRQAKNVAFVSGLDVYSSEDGGENFKKIYTAPQGEDITSIRFSKQEPVLAVAVSSAYGAGVTPVNRGNIIFSIRSDGTDKKDVFISKDVGVFIKDWSLASKTMLVQSGCNRCDQAPRATFLYDLKTKKQTELPSQDGSAIGNLALSESGKKVLYSLALHDKDVQLYGALQTDYYGPPYTIHQYAIDTRRDSVIATVGKKVSRPKSISDIPPPPRIAIAGTSYGRQHYYYYNNTVTVLFDDGSTKKLITPSTPLRDILFVSENQVLATVGTAEKWSLVSFGVKSNSEQVLFGGDQTMLPLGMSDQF